MPETARILRYTTRIISERGLRTRRNFVGPTGDIALSAAIYLAAHGKELNVFRFDEDLSIGFIQCSAPAMQAIRAISNALGTEPPVTEITARHEVPDHIEHIEHWTAHGTTFDKHAPTTARVMALLERTADALDAAGAPHTLAA